MDLKKEKVYFKKGFLRVAGMDEAGRGAWAGPLVVGCVVVTQKMNLNKLPYHVLSEVNDSKKLQPKQRHKLFLLITKLCDWSVGVVSNKEIDILGLQVANQLAFVRAWKDRKKPINFILLDYWKKLDITVPHQGFIRADQSYFSVAAASIVAKEYRDQIMKKIHIDYPVWHFDRHKGYGTNLHSAMLATHGINKYHRRSFTPVQKYI
jgi:ribonuclease HII